ncbi:dihydrolipoyl dehydrogenase [Candidatus Vallotia lariciata]|uniref:dihydrolipoyl dehydrogenase n=1 Tax=Candidatus Vallotia laricis TaxID=2018052 RepID=UPI001D0104B6|nr:dihydrolipoyl dehydrogenase [Candidatus Vallotia lariciata]UDG83071.1 Dihydrolipoyl dehydrogenase [Candidatus Vallotia lariciata]
MNKEFDVIVIGAGPGGYIAAIRAAQLGRSVACIEKWKNPAGKLSLGGTCLNVGCIPSKALLASSEAFENASRHLHDHGISVSNVKINIAQMHARKDAIVNKMTKGIEFLFRKNKVIWLKGHGSFVGKTDTGYQIKVEGEDRTELVGARNVIIATGSKARQLPFLKVDNQIIVDNEGALAFDSVPKKLAIIGAGVIGLELGSLWRRLGADVTVLESLPSFLGTADQSLAQEAAKQFEKQGLKIHLGVQISKVSVLNNTVTILYSHKNVHAQKLEADRLIISIGRAPNTNNLGLEEIGLTVNNYGFIDVDHYCRTKLPGVYAIGDIVRGPMLAHKAEDEGMLVAEVIDGQKPHINYNCIPWVIYTDPEIAWVGKTEAQLQAESRHIKIGEFPFIANGRALAMNRSNGFIKMIADADTDELLGVHIIAANASDLISEAVVAMEFRAASEDIARICHPHPSFSEVMREAALAVDKRALNI